MLMLLRWPRREGERERGGSELLTSLLSAPSAPFSIDRSWRAIIYFVSLFHSQASRVGGASTDVGGD